MKKKFSVTLDPALVAAVDTEAQRRKASRSQIVEESLRAWRDSLLEHQLEAAYLESAEEDRQIAAESAAAMAQIASPENW